MYKKKVFVIIIVLFMAVISTSCSSEGKYNNLINSAEEAINQWDFEKAVGYYEDIMDIDINSLEDGEVKIGNAEDSLENTLEILENIETIKDNYNKSIEEVENLNYEVTNIKKVKEVHEKITNLEDDFYYLSNTNLVKKLEEARNGIETNVKNQIIQTALADFQTTLKDIKFDDSEIILYELYDLKELFPELINTDIRLLQEKLSEEKAKYIEIPIDIIKRDSLMYEDSNGKITFLGEGRRKDRVYAFYKFEGDYKEAVKKINIKANVALSNGNHVDNSPNEFRNYGDYVIGFGYLTDDTSVLIEEFSYISPFDSSEINEFKYENSKIDSHTIPSVYKYTTEELNTKIVLEDETKKVEINKLIFDHKKDFMNNITVTVEGVFTPKEEINNYSYDTLCYLYDPIRKNVGKASFTNYFNKEFTKGFQHDFSFSFKIPEIQKDTKYLTLYFKDLRTNIDLNDGKEYELDKESLDNFIIKNQDMFSAVNINLHSYTGMYFRNQEDKIVMNTIEFDGGEGFFSTSKPKVEVLLGKMYSKLTVELAIDNTTLDRDYSNTIVKFIGNEKVLKEVKIPDSLDVVRIEVPVDGIKILKIAASHNSDNGQKLLLQNGILHK